MYNSPILLRLKEHDLNIATNVDKECNRALLNKHPHERVDYRNKVCVKPWGHEFLAYESKHMAIWCLTVFKGHETSLHCHYNKDTLLIVLDGIAKLTLIDDEVMDVPPMQSIFIPKRKFHAIGTLSTSCTIMEVELFGQHVDFSDKNDVLRIHDMYHREITGYAPSVQVVHENLEMYDYFEIQKDLNTTLKGVTIQTHTGTPLPPDQGNNSLSLILEGRIWVDGQYYGAGSVLPPLSDSQDVHVCQHDALLWVNLTHPSAPFEGKIVYDEDHLDIIVRRIRKQSCRIVMTSGCFDILHMGHIHNLIEAKRRGDVLMVCLSSDRQITALKGESRPINNITERMGVFKVLPFVDYVILYDEKDNAKEETLDALMKVIDPDVWVKGSDYTIEQILMKHPHLKKIDLIPNIGHVSTTKIISRIQTK